VVTSAVRGKGFIRIRHEAEGGLVVLVVDRGEKEALLASDPETVFTTPRYDGYSAVLVHLPAIGVDQLRELIIDAWCVKASNRMLKVLEAALAEGRSRESQ
jgi:hypothetical protein